MPAASEIAHEGRAAGRSRWAMWGIVALALFVGLAGNISSRPMQAHEIFAAQTAREMVWSGDWVQPTYNGKSRLKKPPLMYWLQAAGSAAVGATPPVPSWIARLPSALAGVVIAGICVLLGRRIYGESTGVLAGLMAIGCMGFVEYAWSARPDMLYGACCSVMLLGFASATLAERSPAQRRMDAWVGWLGFAAATLAKGPHVPAIILLGVVVHLLIAGRRRELLSVLRPLTGLVIVSAVCLPWVVAVVAQQEGATGVWVQQLFAGRDGDGDAGASLREWLTPYYLWGLPELLLPWAVALPFGLFVAFQKGREDLARGRVLAWIVITVVVVMSIPNHRRGYYMLPIVAPLMVLMARGASDWLARVGSAGKAPRRIGFAACLVCSIAGGAMFSRAIANGEDAPRVLSVLGGIALIALAVMLWKQGRSPSWTAQGLMLRLCAAPIVLMVASAADREWRDGYLSSTNRFATEVRRLVGQEEPVAFLRMPDAGLVYAQCVYASGRIIPEAEQPEELIPFARNGTLWVILREHHLQELDDHWRWGIRLEHPPDDPGEPSVLLLRCDLRD